MGGVWQKDSFATLETRAMLELIDIIKKKQTMEW